MLKKIFYSVITGLIILTGILLASHFLGPMMTRHSGMFRMTVYFLIGLAVLSLTVYLGPLFIRWLKRYMEQLVNAFSHMSSAALVASSIGALLALSVASLVASALARIPVVGTPLAIMAVLILGYLGVHIGYRKRNDFHAYLLNIPTEKLDKSSKSKKKENKVETRTSLKILDTSVIIDGRILDIYRSGFLTGTLVVSASVLEELQHIADSSDKLRRQRGRHGLECLSQLQKEFTDAIIIDQTEFPDVPEVDAKLIHLAQERGAEIITNDYNLNQIASLQGIRILNINELANAVKPVVLPGETMTVLLVKEGKEANQALAYLEDGTMIVVKNARPFIGQQRQVAVTSILQTAAGRMIFARLLTERDE